MALEDITPRIAVVMLFGVAISVLGIMGGTSLWYRHFQHAALFLISAVVLAVVLFRKRMVALAIIFFCFIVVNAGLTAVFHPTPGGIIVTFGSMAALFAIAKWHVAKYPNLRGSDWKVIFNNEPK